MQVQSWPSLGSDDVVSAVESTLGAIPSQGYPEQLQVEGSILEQMLGMTRGRQAQAGQQENGLDLSDVLSVLFQAGLAFLQAKQAGADMTMALNQALMSALMEARRVDPLQVGSSRGCWWRDRLRYYAGTGRPTVECIRQVNDEQIRREE